ncbi:hypothetical protein FB595_103191 [Sphingobium sp. AEW010]|nr:hypothetical protein FB595_103191 [Sphingobium sp. AEW010]TWD27970.1 hypothetical protein FB596_103124 [Sphingobium sp. AEW013]TWD28959.1 hypothetical protein FB594_103191 [Sphingobium sp. AEW001]
MGNLTAANIASLEVSASWGSLNKDGSLGLPVTVIKRLPLKGECAAASWCEFSVVFDGIKPDEFGFLQVEKVHVGRVSLSKGINER